MTAQTPFSLAGKVALVTGASRGLGLAMAASLARAGARVLINGRDERRLAPVVDLLRAEDLDVAPMAFDVTNATAIGNAFAAIADRFGRLDILVGNVGVRDRRPVSELTREDFSAMLDTNLTAGF